MVTNLAYDGYATGAGEPVLQGVELPHGAPIAVRIQLTIEDWGDPPLLRDPAGDMTTFIDHRELSARRYGLITGIHRQLEVLKDAAVTASVAVNGRAGDQWPELLADIAARGHEIVGHGYDPDQWNAVMDEQEDLEAVQHTADALERASGYRPVGWTGAGSRRGEYTVKSLLRCGYIYTNDFCESDVPFVVARMGERRLIAMSRTDVINDNYAVHDSGQSPGNYVDYFRRSCNRLIAEHSEKGNLGTVVTAVSHSTLMGHPWGADILAECVEYAREQDAWIATSREIAEHYLAALPANDRHGE